MQKKIIYLPLWKSTPAWIKDFTAKIAGGEKEGERLAGLFYNGFFMVHKIGSALQEKSGKPSLGIYDDAVEVNKIAILYWKKQGRIKELSECYQMAKMALLNITNPIPEGQNKRVYFNNHLEDFKQDFNKRAYIMFSQITDVFEDASLSDFDTYLKNTMQKEG